MVWVGALLVIKNKENRLKGKGRYALLTFHEKNKGEGGLKSRECLGKKNERKVRKGEDTSLTPSGTI